ncbi:MAG: hypothetical protein JO071_05125, partial [Deltaproteobacteria bacterium]|nr:hypothetical protein [Deltaproteobacteria bacterium]
MSTTADDQTMESVVNTMQDVANAVRNAANTERDRAAYRGQSAVTGTGLVRSVSRVTYNGAYALAFGIVYPAVFVTQFLPQNNPVMDGFSDG